jgi:hypothetical protein
MRHTIGRLSRRIVTTGVACVGLSMWSSQVRAIEVAFSGFGTVGYALSDQPYAYQRFIDDRGTFKRDTVFGAQADVKLSAQWSATMQAMLAPSLGNDEMWSLSTSWAFLSWRPGNDWLVRLGKQRVPLYLNSENRDVGQTYDFARLPIEMYGLSPTTDLTGLYVSRTWLPDLGEVTLDVFAGEADITVRTDSRDLGALFLPVHTNVVGTSLSLHMEQALFKASYHHTTTRPQGGPGLPASYPYVSAYGYYQVNDQQPGPGVIYADHIANDVITLGADVEVVPTWRVVSELARNIQMRTDNGANTAGGYVALLHAVDRFTPYVSYARLRSMGAPVRSVAQLDGTVLPGSVPGAAQINASQRIAADTVMLYDQDTVALGSAYDLTVQSKLKIEWARTRIGNRSTLVDSPPGGDVVRRTHIHVLSLNYSFVY